VAVLGSGASGVVYLVVHMPTLGLMAAKAVPLAHPSRAHSIKGELAALIGNAAKFNGVSTPASCAGGSAEARRGKGVARRAVLSGARPRSRSCPHEVAAVLPAARAAVAEAAVPSPFFVGFYDAFLEPDSSMLVFVTEYMNAGSVQDLIDASGVVVRDGEGDGGPPLPPPPPSLDGITDERTLVRIAWSALQGLRVLHAKGMIHRDITPSNILLNTRGGVKLADFGLIVDVGVGGEATTQVGSLLYMSPERVAGDPYGPNSDVWGLGMTLLTLLLGRHPLMAARAPTEGGLSYWRILHAINAPILLPAPASGPHGVRQPFLDLLACMLSPSREARPGASELLAHPAFRPYTSWLEAGMAQETVGTANTASGFPPPPRTVTNASIDALTRKMTRYWYMIALREAAPFLPAVPRAAMEAVADQQGWPLDRLAASFLRANGLASAAFDRVREAALVLAAAEAGTRGPP